MSIVQAQALDLLARLTDDGPNTFAGVGEDCHGAYCVYCGARGWSALPARGPDHRRDCPIARARQRPGRVQGDERNP